MAVLSDTEFGAITIRRSKLSRQVKLSVSPTGTLRISMPMYAPVFLAKRLINSSRSEIRQLLGKHVTDLVYNEEGPIGKSHHLSIKSSESFSVKLADRQIIVMTPGLETLQTPSSQKQVREIVARALRREAKSYLPKRLSYLASQHNFVYTKVRFSHASTRWGSCSSGGTISLNIALMKLPFELIDYVLLHELCHTRQMNHSPEFWELMKTSDPDYKLHRKQLRQETPSI